MTKNEAITSQVAALILNGMDAREALNTVCGKDKVDAMISDLYDALRAKAKAQGLT